MLVRGLQCLGDLTADGDDVARRQRPSEQMLGQGATLDMFHRDEVVTVALAGVVDDRDMGMRERRSGLRLLDDSVHSIGVAAGRGRSCRARSISARRSCSRASTAS